MTHPFVAAGFDRDANFFVTHPVCTQGVPREKKILICVPNKDYHDKDVIYAYQLYIEQTLVWLRT